MSKISMSIDEIQFIVIELQYDVDDLWFNVVETRKMRVFRVKSTLS